MSQHSPRGPQRPGTNTNDTDRRLDRLVRSAANSRASLRARNTEIVDLTGEKDDGDNDDGGTMMTSPLPPVTQSEDLETLLRRAYRRRDRELQSTAFQDGPITFASTPNDTAPAAGRRPSEEVLTETPARRQEITGSRSSSITTRVWTLFHKFMVVVVAYQTALFMTELGSDVFQDMAESEGGEVYAYVAGMMRDIRDYDFVFAFGIVYGYSILTALAWTRAG